MSTRDEGLIQSGILRVTEVRHDHIVAVHKYVARLDVSMYDRVTMNVLHTTHYHFRDVYCLRQF